MALGKTTRLGFLTAAVALAGATTAGFAPGPTELPTVEVWHNPT